MNNNVEAHSHVGSYVNPLIISGAGVLCSCLALATYHFILCRLCLRTQPQLHLQQVADTSPTHSIDIPCGVDPDILNKIPILSFSPKKRDVFGLHQSECAICLGELERGEKLRLLPSCGHAFHIPCIDLWLSRHSNCPVCRAPIAIASPPSMSMPFRNDDREFEVLSSHVVAPNRVQDSSSSSSSSSSDQSSASSSRSHAPRPSLQHSLSVAYASRERPEALLMGLKRSLSMDQSCGVAISIQIDQEKASTSSSSSPSSSSAASCARNGVIQGKAISLRQLDHVSTMLMTSLTQLRNTRNEASKGILPN